MVYIQAELAPITDSHGVSNRVCVKHSLTNVQASLAALISLVNPHYVRKYLWPLIVKFQGQARLKALCT